ncbi:hypothetical protein ABZZ04_37110 [Streptomyces sp. NPDC006435]|uniref:hypothetical protein n=1 Tax=Streptomyces sp. NPDC006435 TaxID=3154300 RepID=UPI0033AC0A3D
MSPDLVNIGLAAGRAPSELIDKRLPFSRTEPLGDTAPLGDFRRGLITAAPNAPVTRERADHCRTAWSRT